VKPATTPAAGRARASVLRRVDRQRDRRRTRLQRRHRAHARLAGAGRPAPGPDRRFCDEGALRMNGVTQLRELYADEARDVSEPADVMADVLARATARPAPIRRRWIAPVAAAAAVVAVTGGVVGLVG